EPEPHIAAHTNGTVVAAWIGVSAGHSTNGYNISKDGGATWGGPHHVDSPGGRIASDPVIAFDAAGTAYMVWVGFKPTSGTPPATDMHIYLSKFYPGSSQFGTPVPVSDDGSANTSLVDKPWVTVDHDNNVLVTYLFSQNLITASI